MDWNHTIARLAADKPWPRQEMHRRIEPSGEGDKANGLDLLYLFPHGGKLDHETDWFLPVSICTEYGIKGWRRLN
jgi:hypothetical protein